MGLAADSIVIVATRDGNKTANYCRCTEECQDDSAATSSLAALFNRSNRALGGNGRHTNRRHEGSSSRKTKDN